MPKVFGDNLTDLLRVIEDLLMSDWHKGVLLSAFPETHETLAADPNNNWLQ